jgi:hypothetical protein
VARTEIDFGRYVTRLRNVFSQIMIKPLQLQLALSIPELQDNKQILEAISFQYKSYNLFEEMMEIELMNKRTEFIQTMKDSVVDMDKDGNEVKFFSSKFLVKKYLKLSDGDLALNDKLKQEEVEELNLAGGEGGGEEEAGFESLSKEDKKLILEVLKKSKKKKSKKESEEEIKKEEE